MAYLGTTARGLAPSRFKDLPKGGPTPQIFGGTAPEVPDKVGAREEWTNERIGQLIRAELDDAVEFIESDIAPDRARATEFYDGEPFGNEEEGRSQIVSMDLRDTVLGILPSLVRIFLGSEKAVEFVPRGPDDEPGAKQRTDFMNVVAYQDNPGFRILYTAFKDALIRDYSVLKWWWEDKTEVVTEQYHGQTEDQVLALTEDDDVTEASYEEDGEVPMPPGYIQPDAMLSGEAPPDKLKTYAVTITRKYNVGRARYAALPGEEFFVNRDATTLENATIITHRRRVTRSDLIAMGVSKELIEEHEGVSFAWEVNEEYMARNPERSGRPNPSFNEDLAETDYAETLIRFDEDGDGIAELHKVCTLGSECFVVKVEPAADINFAIISADLEPHKIFGSGFYHILKDLQKIKSAVLRATLDSLRGSIDGKTVINEDRVNIDDALSMDLNQVIRTTGVPEQDVVFGAVPFMGAAGLQVIEYLDSVREQRTGQTKGSQGLDADAMQSTAEMGIAAQLSAAQQRIDLIARIIAETGIKDLFMGLQKLCMRHQDIERTVRLQGTWTAVAPRTWEAALDLVVNVGLGAGTSDERLGRLEKIRAYQGEVLQLLGPSPFVTYKMYRDTLAKMTEISGEGNPSQFFGDIPADWTPPAPAGKPDPATILAEAQAKEVEAKIAIAKAKNDQDREEMFLKTETERMKIQTTLRIEILKLEIQSGKDIDEARINRELETMRIHADREARAFEAEKDHDARIDEANLKAEASVRAAAAAPKPKAGA